jgi:hypothetical protein
MPETDDPARDSAPDLQILGDKITLQPSGFVEAARKDEEEEALMKQMSRFRSEPLQYALIYTALWPH